VFKNRDRWTGAGSQEPEDWLPTPLTSPSSHQ